MKAREKNAGVDPDQERDGFRKALHFDAYNVVRKVKAGKPLTAVERKTLIQAADWIDRRDVVKALHSMRERACEDCCELIDIMLGNLNGEPR